MDSRLVGLGIIFENEDIEVIIEDEKTIKTNERDWLEVNDIMYGLDNSEEFKYIDTVLFRYIQIDED